MKGIWEDEEVKSLFSLVEENKLAGKPIRDAFMEHSKKYGRKPNSVRNYYYHEIDRLHDDMPRASRIGVNLEKHQKNQFSFFTEEEKDKIIAKIKEKLSEGYSVRKACYLLSGGDVKQMLRLQNKYRANETSRPSNVVMFKPRKSNLITDSDIEGLFMGLVKLVKKNALDQAHSQVAEEQIEKANSLRSVIVQLGKKERELKFLKDDYAQLKKENALLKKRLLISTCYKAREMSKKDKEA